MVEVIEIGDLKFSSYEQASDAFGSLLYKLPLGLPFTLTKRSVNRFGLSQTTMLALYEEAAPRRLFSPTVHPNEFYVLRDKHQDRVFAAEYCPWFAANIMVPFDYRISLYRLFSAGSKYSLISKSQKAELAGHVGTLN
jgi:hypothetical protein